LYVLFSEELNVNQVKVICKLPAGLVLEAGYHMDYQMGRFVNGPNYKRAVLKGSLQAQVARLHAVDPKAQPVATRDWVPSETMVDEDLAREWFRQHANGPLVKNGLVAIVEKPNDLKPMVADMTQVLTGLEPLDVSKPGADSRTAKIGPIETADFVKERG
jgi:hypothetical protein